MLANEPPREQKLAWRELVDRAEKGDRSVLPELRRLLQDPNVIDRMGGNVAQHVELMLIAQISGKDLMTSESLTRKMEVLREDLTGQNPTALERLLAERIALCWLALHKLESDYLRKPDISVSEGNYLQRAIDRAQRRYLSAVKTLAQVRKLALPILQVNIGQRQINVAGLPLGGDDGKHVVSGEMSAVVDNQDCNSVVQ
jgi:hypothetical protein